MKRSSWKVYHLEKDVNKSSRSCIIRPDMINSTIKVHNGKSTKDIKITVGHVKHRLGEFYHTKVTPRFKGGKKN